MTIALHASNSVQHVPSLLPPAPDFTDAYAYVYQELNEARFGVRALRHCVDIDANVVGVCS